MLSFCIMLFRIYVQVKTRRNTPLLVSNDVTRFYLDICLSDYEIRNGGGKLTDAQLDTHH